MAAVGDAIPTEAVESTGEAPWEVQVESAEELVRLYERELIHGALFLHTHESLVAGLPVPSAAAGLELDLYATLLERHTRAVSDTAGTRVDYEALRGSADWRRLVGGLETADPDALPSREARLAFWINVYNVLAIPLAALGLVPPWLAAVGMSASSLIVMINAARVLRPERRVRQSGAGAEAHVGTPPQHAVHEGAA